MVSRHELIAAAIHAFPFGDYDLDTSKAEGEWVSTLANWIDLRLSEEGQWWWYCMICDDERPNMRIDVYHRPIRGLEDMFPDARINVRYCNDRYACIIGARNFDMPLGAQPAYKPRDRRKGT